MIPKKIKTFWLVSAAVLVAAVAVTVALWPRTEVSAVYRAYADRPGVDATFLRNFPVDDTLRLDVTLLQATDSAGWELLKKEFNVKEFPSHVTDSIDSGKDVVSVKLTPKDHPGQPMDTSDLLNNNVIATSRLLHTISIFEVHSEAEIDAVLHSEHEYSINQ